MSKYYYNGVLLPEIPADILAEYPYCVMYYNSVGTQFLLAGPNTWWANDALKKLYASTTTTYVRYELTDLESEWTYDNSWTDNGALPFEGIIWSNRNIPNGSTTATNIYFFTSEPVPYPDLVFEDYAIKRESLTAIADAIRGKTGKEDSLTLEQMVTEIEGIEAGGSGQMYAGSAIGAIVPIPKGTATSEFILNIDNYESSAVGALS